jgi:hypothetical protein
MCDPPTWINIYSFNLPQAEENYSKYRTKFLRNSHFSVHSGIWIVWVPMNFTHLYLFMHLLCYILLPVLICTFRILLLSQCMEVKELQVLCQRPVFNLSHGKCSHLRHHCHRCSTDQSIYITHECPTGCQL